MAAAQWATWSQRATTAEGLDLDAAGIDREALAAAWTTSLGRPPTARHRALVALDRASVVGFVLCGPGTDPDLDPALDGELAELTVHPDHRGTGHGSRLIQAGVDTLVADGFTRAVVWVEGADDRLRGFLAGAGWEPDGASRELALEEVAASGANAAQAPTGRLKQIRLQAAIGTGGAADDRG